MNIFYVIKQVVKMCLQSFIFPVLYLCFKRKTDENLVLFADAHHDSLPDEMEEMYYEVKKTGKTVRTHFLDYAHASGRQIWKSVAAFMRDYGQASVVFICDYYLPAGACRKKAETKVVQLWHACGALKRFGFDAKDDVPGFYKGNPMKNVTLVTVSAKWCIPIYARAMGLPAERVQALGVSRTDRYFRASYQETCIESFYKEYPEARGKRIVLWAPTFRGNAGNPRLKGIEAVRELSESLGDEWYVIQKLHPHLEGKAGVSNCRIRTEKLLPVCDILITDYSSILFDYMIYQKPLILFAPDKKRYEMERGTYIPYSDIPGQHVSNKEDLLSAVKTAVYDPEAGQNFLKLYMEACDGHATERIIKCVFQ